MQSSLNHIYRLVWSAAQCRFVPVPETARGRGKGGRSASRAAAAALATVAMAATSLSPAWAQLPTGGEVVGGSGSIATQGNTMTVTQTTDRMVANWQTFSIGKDHTVNFVQPSSSSVALNRVLGSDVSVIQGAINANGKVFLVNPNGVLFTKDAQVDVGSMVASTLNISTTDFMAGNYRFEGVSSSAIVNQGRITAHGHGAAGGTVALIAAKITNQGSIAAHAGNVLMGAGSKVLLDLGGPVKIQVEQGAIDALIEQGGAIKADGGLVYLSAKAAGDLVSTVINHTGMTEAQTLATGETGQIYLMGGMQKDRIEVAGKLDASAPKGGDGGFIETSAANVQIQPGLVVTTKAENGQTGEWLIDPTDIYIVAGAGGSSLSGTPATNSNSGNPASSNIHNQTINTALALTNVNITTASDGSGAGDIFVNAGLEWSSGNTLTLNASRNIEINATIDASQGNGGKLVLEYGQGSANGVINSQQAYYLINAPVRLQASGAENGSNATATNFTTKLGSGGTPIHFTTITNNDGAALNTQLNSNLAGNFALSTGISLTGTGNWTPVGTYMGRFDGLGHSISNLSIDKSAVANVGFFGQLNNATVANLSITNADVTGLTGVGVFVGKTIGTTTITNAHVSGKVTAGASGSGASDAGGFVGFATPLTIRFSSAAVDVTAAGRNVGGFVGDANGGVYQYIVATGNATSTGRGQVGGFGGLVRDSASISDSFALGNATQYGTADQGVGGFIGSFGGTSSNISRSYSVGTATGGDSNQGGFIGRYISGTLADNFWDIDASSHSSAAGSGAPTGVAGLTTAEMKVASNFTNWTFDSSRQNWVLSSELAYGGYPTLRYTGGFSVAPTNNEISTLANLLWLTENSSGWDKNYTLTNSINAAFTAGWNDGKGWSPIGTNTNNSFTGRFDGNNHTISNLTINVAAGGQGLFGYAKNATIENIGLVGIDFTITAGTGIRGIGGLVGYADNASISNAFTTGVIATATGSSDKVGGLVGLSKGSWVIDNSYSTVAVTGGDDIGGLVGRLETTPSGNGVLSNSYATGAVTGFSNIGGLVGQVASLHVQVTNSYATGEVRSLATQWINPAGGLVGYNNRGYISNSYSTGAVIGIDGIGGLVGQNYEGHISNSYSIGAVTGLANTGGLVGINDLGTVVNSFWNTDTVGNGITRGVGSGGSDPAGVVGKTTAQMQTPATFTTDLVAESWDTSIWSFNANRGAAVAGYEFGGVALPYLTGVTRSQDVTTQGATILFAGGWGGQTAEDQRGADGSAYTITNWNQLQNINLVVNQGFDFALSNNLDSSTVGYAEQASATANGNKGWSPIGNSSLQFTGFFDGNNNTISNLTINTADRQQGLFGNAKNATIENIGLLGIDFTITNTHNSIGALVGYAEDTSVSNAFSTGVINATNSNSVGGLVGYSTGNWIIDNSYSSVVVSGYNNVGGLVGELAVNNSSSESGTLSNSYATGVVDGYDAVGGLVGLGAGYIQITNSYATGAVDGTYQVGGLVGWLFSNSEVTNSYATGDVTSTNISWSGAGGLVGANSGTITNSYAIGAVIGSEETGALVGFNDGTFTNSFWNIDTVGNGITRGVGSGGSDPAGVFGKTTTEMQTPATFTTNLGNDSWDISIWSFPKAGTAAAVEGYEFGGSAGLPYLTKVTRTEDRVGEAPVILFAGGWGGLTDAQQTGADGTAYTITTAEQLQNINLVANSGYNFVLLNNINLSGITWTPIGASGNAFNGHFDGQNKTLSNLTVVESSGAENQGLFGLMENGTIQNLKLSNVNITSDGRFTGGLVGRVQAVNNGDIRIQNIEMDGVTILTSIDASSANVGGVVGRLDAGSSSSTNIALESILINNLSLTQDFTRGDYIGGIVGETEHSGSGEITLRKLAVRDSTIDAKNSRYVGGLVGRLRDNSLLDDRNVFIGTVDGGYEVGGLAGRLSSNSILSFGYVHADVTGHTTGQSGRVGIITGYTSSNDQSITEVYAVGTAKHATENSTEAPRVGVVGYSDNAKAGGDVFEDIYYFITDGSLPFLGAKDADGEPTITNVVELTQAQMQGAQARQNMTGVADARRWNFDTNWLANQGAYPIFRWESVEFGVPFVVVPAPVAPAPVAPTANNRAQQAIQSVQSILNSVAMGSQGLSSNNLLPVGSSGSGVQSLNTPAASVAANVGGGSAVPAAPASVSVSGGLAFVSLPAEPSDTSEGAASPAQQAALSNDAAGRDTSGFMRVFVVQGGINLPEQASGVAEQNTGGNQ